MVKNKKKYLFFFILVISISLIANISDSKSFVLFSPKKTFKISFCPSHLDYDYSYVWGYWKLNETSGTNALDSSVSGNNGTLKNMEDGDWIEGKLNNSLLFDGVNEYVDIGNLSIPNDSPFSVDLWLNTTKGGGWQGIIGKHDVGLLRGWLLYLQGTKLSFMRQHNNVNWIVIQCTFLLSLNTWHHIALAYGSLFPLDLSLYIDGVKRNDFGMGFGNPTDFQAPDVNLTIGYSAIAGYFQGQLDNIVLYNRSLTQSQVNCRYNKSFGCELIPDLIPPTYSNLTESIDPLELGDNKTITLEVCDNRNLTSVYLQVDNVNYTMINIYNDTYSLTWNPITTGQKPYTIWMLDQCNNTSTLTGSFVVLSSFEISISIFLIFTLLTLMIFLYTNLREFLPILVVFLFSILFGSLAVSIVYFPFTPFIQIFFMLFQSSIFMLTTIEIFKKGD